MRTALTYHGHVDSPESRESAQVTSLAWSPDGKFIVSASIVDYTVQMWDSTTGKTLWKRPLKQVSSVAWSSDGQWIAAAGDGVIKIFAASTGSVMGVDSGYSGFVRSVSWFPDNKHLASVGDDRTLQVWDAVTEKTNITYPIQTTFSALHVAISPDGKYLAYGTADGIVQVSASMTMQKLISHGGNQFQGVQALAWSPDGKKIVSEATSVSSGNTLVDVWQAISS